jgi:hypothetical protein
MAKKINYNSRTFDDYREQLLQFTQRYYPELINDFQDAAIGSYLIDLHSAIGDDLGHYIDDRFKETQLDYMQDRKSLLSAARNNNLKVPGKRPSILEAVWSCTLPPSQDGGNTPDWSYAPIIGKGSQASGAGQKFELQEDLNFSEQFNQKGVSDRTIIPIRGVNGTITGYSVSKSCVMSSGEGKIFKQTITTSDVEPFMEIVLPDKNVLQVESVLIYDGYVQTTPTIGDFMDVNNRWYEF